MVVGRNILLIYPKYSYPRKSPPLGLAYLASYMRSKGYRPLIVDLNIDDYSDEKLCQIIHQYNPFLCGISFMTNQYGECLRLVRLLKSVSPSSYVVTGGPHVSALPREILQECQDIDFSVKGEGEITFSELLEALDAGNKDLSGIDGLCYRLGKEIIENRLRAPIPNIGAIPFPAWHLLKVDKYSVFSSSQGKTFAILSSRGCPNRCIFCDSHTIFGRRFRARSAENIFDEIMYLHDNYGMVQFDFIDDQITLKKNRVSKLCELIKNSKIPFKWMANARVDTIDKEMLRAMKESGCIRIDVGVESGDPTVRKRMPKSITDEQIISTHKLARKVGIQIGTFAMVGNLGETMDSVIMTARLLQNIGEDVMVSISCPFPGTELYQIAKQNGYVRVTDWSRYVTSPTYLQNYEPVMVTDCINQEQILKAYYYLNSFHIKRKFQARYGKFFLLNPRFIKEWLSKSSTQGGFLRKFSMVINLIKSRLAL